VVIEKEGRRQRRRGGSDVIREGEGEKKREGRGGSDGWVFGRLKYELSNI
jgi:hypothetical protein